MLLLATNSKKKEKLRICCSNYGWCWTLK